MEWFDWEGADPALRRPRPDDSFHRLGVRPGRSVPPPRQLERILGPLADSPGTCSVLIRREALDTLGGFEDEFPGLHEDQVAFAKILLHYPVFVMARCLDFYRQHHASHCHVAEARGEGATEHPNPARLRYLTWLQSYASQLPDAGRVPAIVAWELWLHRHPEMARLVRGLRRVRIWVTALPGRVLRSVVFTLGRALVPAGLRQWAWARWQRGRAFDTGAAQVRGGESP